MVVAGLKLGHPFRGADDNGWGSCSFSYSNGTFCNRKPHEHACSVHNTPYRGAGTRAEDCSLIHWYGLDEPHPLRPRGPDWGLPSIVLTVEQEDGLIKKVLAAVRGRLI